MKERLVTIRNKAGIHCRPSGVILTAIRNEFPGHTFRLITADGVETELMQLGAQDIHGCLACGGCRGTHRCVIDDAVNKAAVTGASDKKGVLAEVFATVPVEFLTDINERFATELFSRNANPESKPISDAAFTELATNALAAVNTPMFALSPSPARPVRITVFRFSVSTPFLWPSPLAGLSYT